MSQTNQDTRLEMVNSMLDYHYHQFAVGYPKGSKYIPYTSVYEAFKQQHKSAIKRLEELKKRLEEENESI